MEQQDNTQPGFDLPQPQMVVPTPPSTQQVTPVPVDVNDTTFASVTSAGIAVTPPTAEDSDLIEHAWVNQAKHIVASTHDDPYRQQQELKKLRADYIRKRYNKEISVGE